jgi:acyl carrier protein
MPRSPNGKIDRKQLPSPGQSRPELETAFVAPRSRTEASIARIWAEILNLDAIGINDNFFDVGGHSLLATRVISRLRGEFDINLPLRVLFEQPTVGALADYIELLIRAPQKDDASNLDSERESIEL